MLTIQNVAGGYNGHKIVKDLSFQVHEGEFFWNLRSEWQWKNKRY